MNREFSRSVSRSRSRSRSRTFSPSGTDSRSQSYSGSNDGSRSRSQSHSDASPTRSRSRSVSRSPRPSKRRRTSAPRVRQGFDHPSDRLKLSEIKRPRALPDVDRARALERQRQAEENAKEVKEIKPFDPKAEYERLLGLRSGGTYVPPARLRALQAQLTDKSTTEFQRLAWEDLKKGINGLVNKVNRANIRQIAESIFKLNLVRGRGLLVRSLMRAQAASLPFTPVFAALAAVINTKLPQIGELLVTRLIIQFRKAFRRNDKTVCISCTMFLGQLCNYQIAHEIVILQILHLLLERPTDDSVEIAVGFIREVGAFLEEASAAANNGVFERLRAILHEGQLDKRTQYMIEVLFLVRKNKYIDNPTMHKELDLVEEEDQITHMISLDDELNGHDALNVFKADPDYEENEKKYKTIRDEILGDSDEEEQESEDSDASSEEENEDEDLALQTEKTEDGRLKIHDMTNQDLSNLRRTIYLTIRSSMDYEECCHKLMRISLDVGMEIELVNMIIECCSQEKIYSKFYGLIAERFCEMNRRWREPFGEAFRTYYDTIHRYETNKIRNIAMLFGHCFAANALRWDLFSCIHLNEEETTASSRIFVKIMFQQIVEEMGVKSVLETLRDPYLEPSLAGLFPKNNPTDTRFAINYFTAIGLGAVTEDLREYLKKATERAAKIAEQEQQNEKDQERRSSSRTRSIDSRDDAGSRGSTRSYDSDVSYASEPSYDSEVSYDSQHGKDSDRENLRNRQNSLTRNSTFQNNRSRDESVRHYHPMEQQHSKSYRSKRERSSDGQFQDDRHSFERRREAGRFDDRSRRYRD
ncbi:pre-mRNA-splicing factor CWC22 [Lipomyces oligophaga]|uniref:pre-mRNA-splicing factor CWC22 n=1 Tax=Lipomyces oligophaga TaxID=45792 RepID=UPI0034CECB3C